MSFDAGKNLFIGQGREPAARRNIEMNDTYTYRLEEEKDFFTTENLTREAFWDVYKPGCNEHLLLHNMRKAPCFIKDLAYVCEAQDGIIVGASYCTETRIRDGETDHIALCIGPIGVLPEYQGRGIGLKLLSITLARAKALGYSCAVLYGNPDYYHKSGFTDAARFGIHNQDGSDMSAFMCFPLDLNKMATVKGCYQEDPVFNLDEDELNEFEKRFPPKVKHSLPGQIFG